VPWRLHQNYLKDIRLFSGRQLEDGTMSFQRRQDDGARVSSPVLAGGLSGPHTQNLVVNGGHVRYRDEGDGTPVVLVHGIGRSLEDWTEQHELLAGRGYRVVSLDLAGFGESDPLSEPYSLPALARFLEAFLDAVGIAGPAHLVGNSLGGAVAMQLAVQSPERVRSLVLPTMPDSPRGRPPGPDDVGRPLGHCCWGKPSQPRRAGWSSACSTTRRWSPTSRLTVDSFWPRGRTPPGCSWTPPQPSGLSAVPVKPGARS
jgi:pimeloyl-ACP methyl ester carboxylesterase